MNAHEAWKAQAMELAEAFARIYPNDGVGEARDALLAHLEALPLGDPVAWIAAKGEHVRTVKPGPSVVAMAGCSALYRDPRTVEVEG